MDIHTEYALSQALVAGGQAGIDARPHIDAAVSALAGLENDSARINAVIQEVNKRLKLVEAYHGEGIRGTLTAQLAVLVQVVREIPALAGDLSIAAKLRLASREVTEVRTSESHGAGTSTRAAA